MEVARRLQRRIRTDELLARSGGDEFVIVAPAMRDRTEISRRAADMLETLAAPVSVGGRECSVAASIGISVFPFDAQDSGALLRNADVAMYAAKKRGGATFQYYTTELQQAASRRFRMESALRRAMENGEFTLAFQPVLHAGTGNISAVEALLRWNDPELGPIPPSEFIPFAEETGAIIRIGGWVFEQAFAQAKRWADAGRPVRVWINVAAAQLKDPTLSIVVRELLHRHQLDSSLVGIELTESAFIGGDNEVVTTLNKIKALGVKIALDDFGVKYSSLDYLQRLPIDTIKIDRAFIQEIATNRFNASIVRAIIAVGHDLGYTVTAEGVESAEQLEILQTLRCDHWQGFLFSPAAAPHEIDALAAPSPALYKSFTSTPSGS